MTEEQETIERLQYLIDDIRRNKIKACELISEEGKYNLADDIETVLNMLKDKDKEIEFQNDINKAEKDRHKKTEKSLKGQIIKQNKMIDLMAEYWNSGLVMCENCDKIIVDYNENKCKDCIQYFKSKAEKE